MSRSRRSPVEPQFCYVPVVPAAKMNTQNIISGLFTLPVFLFACITSEVAGAFPGEDIIQPYRGELRIPTSLLGSLNPSPNPYDTWLQMKIAPYWKFGSIKNLGETVNSFQSDRCHMTVTNFQGVDIDSQIKFPILLRKPELAWLWRFRDNYTTPSLIWVPAEYNSFKILFNFTFFPSKDEFHIKEQQQLVHNPPDIYVQLNESRNVKPWNCHVAVALFPPLPYFVYLKATFPKVFFVDPTSPRVSLNIVPSRLPEVSILIFNNYLQRVTDNRLVQILEYISFRNSRYIITNRIFFLLNALTLNAENGNDPISKTVGPNMYIQTTQLLQICRTVNYAGIDMKVNKINISDLSEWKSLSSVKCHPQGSQNLYLWNIKNYAGTKKREDTVLSHILACEPTSRREATLRKANSLEQLSNRYAESWRNVMGNYSFNVFVSNRLRICVNGKFTQIRSPGYLNWAINLSVEQIHSTHVAGMRGLYPVALSWPGSLQFVSCGERGYEKLPFSKLFAVFDTSTWCLLLLTLLAMPIPLQHHEKDWFKSFTSVIKVFLEQGEPFSPNAIQTSKKFSWFLASFMAVGLILSNAFKSTNLNKMIHPRKPLAYQNLKELVNDKFTIYTRSSTALFAATNIWKRGDISELPWVVQRHRVYQEVMPGKISVNVTSEVESFSHRRGRKNESCGALSMESKMLLEKSTSLLPKTVELIQKIVSDNSDLHRKTMLLEESLQLENKLEEAFLEEEEHSIFNFLTKCDKTAAMLPTYLSKQFAGKLHILGNPHVFVGEDVYFDSKIVFALNGIIPRFLIQRIQALETAGISSWLSRVTEKNDFNSELSSIKWKEPQMSGNIAVIFVLLVAGLCLSPLCFLCEITYDLISNFRNV